MTPYTLTDGGVVPGAGPLVLDFGGPMSGRDWDVRRIAYVAPELLPAVPGTVGLVTIGVSTPTLIPTELADVYNVSPAGNYGAGTLVVIAPERLGLWCYGFAAGVTVVAVAQVQEHAS